MKDWHISILHILNMQHWKQKSRDFFPHQVLSHRLLTIWEMCINENINYSRDVYSVSSGDASSASSWTKWFYSWKSLEEVILGWFKDFHKELKSVIKSVFLPYNLYHRELACEMWPALIQPMVPQDIVHGSSSSLPQKSKSELHLPYGSSHFIHTVQHTDWSCASMSCTNTMR